MTSPQTPNAADLDDWKTHEFVGALKVDWNQGRCDAHLDAPEGELELGQIEQNDDDNEHLDVLGVEVQPELEAAEPHDDDDALDALEVPAEIEAVEQNHDEHLDVLEVTPEAEAVERPGTMSELDTIEEIIPTPLPLVSHDEPTDAECG